MITPVSLEIAKLLKEKGFDKVMKYHYPNLSIEKQEICLATNWNKFTDMSGNSQYYSAPTISEVIMWLYEKQGIWIEVQCPDMPTELWSFNIHRFQKYGGYGDGGDFNSPTEAYQAAIEYTLNNLIP